MKHTKVAISLFGLMSLLLIFLSVNAQGPKNGKVVDLTWEFLHNETYQDIEYDSTTHEHVFRPHFRERLSAINGQMVSINGYLSMIHDTTDFWIISKFPEDQSSGNYNKELSIYLKPPVLFTDKDEGKMVKVIGKLELAGINPHKLAYTMEEAFIKD